MSFIYLGVYSLTIMFHKKEPLISIHVTLPEKLYDMAMEKKTRLLQPSLSGYIQQLIRDDVGVRK
jgi:hypothetical protein